MERDFVAAPPDNAARVLLGTRWEFGGGGGAVAPFFVSEKLSLLRFGEQSSSVEFRD